jgi:hypothetical protein
MARVVLDPLERRDDGRPTGRVKVCPIIRAVISPGNLLGGRAR